MVIGPLPGAVSGAGRPCSCAGEGTGAAVGEGSPASGTGAAGAGAPRPAGAAGGETGSGHAPGRDDLPLPPSDDCWAGVGSEPADREAAGADRDAEPWAPGAGRPEPDGSPAEASPLCGAL